MTSEERLLRVLDDIAGVRLVVVGDVMLDYYAFGDAARLSPEAPVPVVRVTADVYRPGGAANTAVNVRALGAAVSLVAAVGDDDNAEILRQLLDRANVNTDGLLTVPQRPTTWKGRVIARHQHVVRLDRETDEPLDETTIERLITNYAAKLADADGVILSDYGKGVVTEHLAAAVTARAKGAGKIVCVDPKENHFSLYRGVTSITPNHLEATAAAGIREADDPTLTKTGQKLLSALGSESVLITCGERGMVLFHADGALDRIPTRAREVYDVAGAGDTVIATFTAALAAGANHLEAAQLANFAAGVVVGKVGTATATPEEIRAAMKRFFEENRR